MGGSYGTSRLLSPIFSLEMASCSLVIGRPSTCCDTYPALFFIQALTGSRPGTLGFAVVYLQGGSHLAMMCWGRSTKAEYLCYQVLPHPATPMLPGSQRLQTSQLPRQNSQKHTQQHFSERLVHTELCTCATENKLGRWNKTGVISFLRAHAN